mgnify:CR=1 FL=1
MLDFTNSNWYKVLVFSVIMPLSGTVIIDRPLVGTALILCQIPWFIKTCCKD